MNPEALSPREFLKSAAEGTRVVVRYRIPGGFTDALGFLRTCDGTSCTVQTRKADVVIVLSDVVAAKAVPPAPERRAARVPHP
ncbi:hypothetical protein V1639_05635 [Pseudarthrobacter sp. J75]|uniref:putative acetyltransferase n=1 Tax=unclassified Pseudarthrobacter TaxID=2647000 RepID=UPI002E80AED6|nr:MULTISPECIES: hypothetical protein [unclassified Pseudarthrobacter]MEE2521279.1 hypothetical protein [Pseudarthrobacter sp. J47]MEE2528511.1 hypothetical protein [Pseudarthrobacter sp. J75]